MSLNGLLYRNNLDINGRTLYLKGKTPQGNIIAPVICDSNIACANLNAEIWDGKWINGTCQVGDLLVCSNAVTQTFTLLPVGANGTVLTANSLSSSGVSWD